VFSINLTILTALLAFQVPIAADTLLGVLVAFRSNTFSIGYLGHFIESVVLPYDGGLAVLGVLSALTINGVPAMDGAVTGFFASALAAATAMLGRDIVAKLGSLLGPAAPPPPHTP